MSDYSNRQIVLHLEVKAFDGSWLADRQSFRASVEACVAIAERIWPDHAWRVVDANGNIHEHRDKPTPVRAPENLWGGNLFYGS